MPEMTIAGRKIGFGECNNYPLVEHIAGYGKPVILSTGDLPPVFVPSFKLGWGSIGLAPFNPL
jgi:hypothetical protein